jgi:hypothetical protein
MKKLIPLLICFSYLQLLLVSCSEKSDPSYDQENFTAIFDNNQFSAANYPIDFKQTADGGYLILGERRIANSNFRGIYLMKVDKTGKFVSSVEVESEYVNPVGDLITLNDQYYFFCMDALNLEAQLVQVDANAENITITPTGGGITYPAAAALDNTTASSSTPELLLLSYNHNDKLMAVTVHGTSGTVSDGPSFFDIGAGDDVEEPIVNHFIRTGKRFPFQIGRISGGPYYFNGFENYTFSLIFTDLNDDGSDGVVQGQQDDGGFSAIHPLGGNKFAASRFNFGDNYFLPNVNLVTNAPSIGVDLGGNTLPELVTNAPVKIISAEVNTKKVLIFASDTKSKQIGLFFYDEATGEFLSSRYLGFSNPFEVANVLQTEDGGLAVCGTTYLAGRFPRICLIKISKGELSAHTN